jgi:hypothetical protein
MLINKRKKGLAFSNKDVTSRTFFTLIEKSRMVSSFAIKAKLNNIRMTEFDSFQI